MRTPLVSRLRAPREVARIVFLDGDPTTRRRAAASRERSPYDSTNQRKEGSMRFLSSVVVAVAIGLVVTPAAGGATKARGTFATLPAGTDLGLEIEGISQIKRTGDDSVVKASVRGLEPGATYAAHLHNAPCSDANPGGAHYMHDPAGPSVPPNELWLSSTDDPTAGITANAAGVAHGRGSADWVARADAQSVVIHYIPPGGTTAGGPKIACADLDSGGG